MAAKGLHDKLTPDKVEHLKTALIIYGGDYLAELDYAWVLPAREHLRQLYQEIHACLARNYLGEKDYHPAIHHLRILVEIDSFAENYYCQLMLAQAGLGDRGAVKKQYDLLRKILSEELGLEPEPGTKELYLKLANQ